ncbi:MAG: esterase-like activity of phytase family protein [Oscillatoriaceae bacterium SKYG93]|nr:esterase-like activity of phytase family protein [Oscillatoriaceae bacterium SKYG93]MDW8452779.1 esterase-like activity of phytase family protein [Oscillatoriaceae cyanobacterium SKYGB_i_bin93]HIK27151.1 esterase-like activity of phytase family protein [Oscillatoriaceae cyanobacterium M7585_C2015_266]
MLWALGLILLSGLCACDSPRVIAKEEGAAKAAQERLQTVAEKRIFLDLSLEFLDEYELPEQSFEGTPVGGLSALAYDRQRDRFYALSDDPSQRAAARFYTLRLAINSQIPGGGIKIDNVQVEDVTILKREDGQPYPRNTIDPEGIAFAPPNSIFIASEGISNLGIAPFISEFDLTTGKWQRDLPIPKRYIPDAMGSQQQQGVQNNLGFESLSVNTSGALSARIEPIRLFTATEAPLLQDREPPSSEKEARNRLLHYLVEGNSLGTESASRSTLISEHVYPLDYGPRWSLTTGLSELVALGQGGYFLSLERALGFLGYGARIFQVATGAATDTSNISSLKGELKGIEPVRKKLVLDLANLGIILDNLEGMTLGPRLPDGTQSLVLVSDNDFEETRKTQILLFRLKQGG